MSNRTFQFYLVWFRALLVLRSVTRKLTSRAASVYPHFRNATRWTASVWFAPVHISFEVYIELWATIAQRAEESSGVRVRTWHRAFFCLSMSLVAWQAFLLVAMNTSITDSTLLVSTLHGILIFLTWKRGLRWGRKVLRVRPVRARDTANPYGGLDFGN